MNTKDYCNKIYRLLKQLPIKNDNVYYSGNFGIKCPYCGHTDKTKTSTHMNVKLDVDDGEFPVFHCVKCDSGGIVTKDFLEDLNIFNTDISMYESQLKVYISKNVHKKGIKNNNIKLKILPPLDIPESHKKIKYLSNRLGINITTNDLLKYKIILNLKDFLAYNNINIYTRDERIIESLDKKYIGFLSTNNEFISFRNISDNYTKYEKRYINYNIFGLKTNTRRIYTIPNKLDILKPANIIITEGVIDLLGIYNHLESFKELDNSLFISTMGLGHDNVIKYLNKMGILFGNYHIFPDNDGKLTLSDFRKMKRNLSYNMLHCTMTVHYNKIGKDFGVTKDKIKLQTYHV